MTMGFDNPNPYSTQLSKILSGKFIYKPLILQNYIYGCPSFLLYVAVNENTAFKNMLLRVIKSDVIQQRWLNNKCHIFFVRQCHLLSLPQAIVDGEGINGDSEMFCMDLREAFTSRIVSENYESEFIIHKHETKFQWTKRTVVSQCLWLNKSNHTVTNIRSHFQDKCLLGSKHLWNMCNKNTK